MYEIVKTEENKRTVRFTETKERISKLFNKIRKQISRDLQMPGFRRGRVPRSVIDRQYGNVIKAEVADTVRRELTSELLEKEDWILDNEDPEGKMELPSQGKPYSFEMTFSLFETPEPADTEGIAIEVPTLDLEKAVEDTIQSFREKMVNFETVERASREGDLVILEATPGGHEEDVQEFSVRIGDENIGAGFDELVTGVSPGFSFSARMESPEEDEEGGDAEAPDNPVHRFRVKEVKEPVLPELNDEFAEKAAGADSMEELREKVTDSMQDRYRQEVEYLKERKAIESLLESNPFDPPRYMVNNLKSDFVQRLGEEEPGESTLEAAEDLARDKVREFLILRAVAKKEDIQLEEEEISEEKSPEESEYAVVDRLRNRKAMELILGKANITEKKPEAEQPEGEKDESSESTWRWVAVEPDRDASTQETEGEEQS